MSEKKDRLYPKTQHSRVYDEGERIENPFVTLDSPDDRITSQDGDGATFVSNDNPDDVESE